MTQFVRHALLVDAQALEGSLARWGGRPSAVSIAEWSWLTLRRFRKNQQGQMRAGWSLRRFFDWRDGLGVVIECFSEKDVFDVAQTLHFTCRVRFRSRNPEWLLWMGSGSMFTRIGFRGKASRLRELTPDRYWGPLRRWKYNGADPYNDAERNSKRKYKLRLRRAREKRARRSKRITAEKQRRAMLRASFQSGAAPDPRDQRLRVRSDRKVTLKPRWAEKKKIAKYERDMARIQAIHLLAIATHPDGCDCIDCWAHCADRETREREARRRERRRQRYLRQRKAAT